jgi:hypothetical protein
MVRIFTIVVQTSPVRFCWTLNLDQTAPLPTLQVSERRSRILRETVCEKEEERLIGGRITDHTGIIIFTLAVAMATHAFTMAIDPIAGATIYKYICQDMISD